MTSLGQDFRALDGNTFHGLTTQGRRMQLGFCPEFDGAGAIATVQSITVADWANRFGGVNVMQRDPLRVRLCRLTMNRLAVQTGNAGRGEILRRVQRTETIQAVEPTHRRILGAGSISLSASVSVPSSGALRVPCFRKHSVDEPAFFLVELGIRVSVDARNSVLEESG